MSESYYIRKRGRISGPFTLARLRELSRKGQFLPIHEVSTDQVSWRPASDLADALQQGSASGTNKEKPDALTPDEMGIELLPESSCQITEGFENDTITIDDQSGPGPTRSTSDPVDSGPSATDIAEPAEGSDTRFLRVIIVGAVLLLVGVTIPVLVVHYISSAETQRRLAALTAEVDLAIQEAGTHIEACRFDDARQVLDKARQLAEQSPLTVAYKQVARLGDELEKVDAAEEGYQDKLARGYEIFEGRFISPQEKAEILETRRQQEEERRRREEEQRRAEERRQAEERRRQAEQQMGTAYLMSQEFIKESLKSPSSARFPSYPDSDIIVTYDEDSGHFNVMAWVEGQNAFGVYLRKKYLCVLWPVGGDRWKCSMATILD